MILIAQGLLLNVKRCIEHIYKIHTVTMEVLDKSIERFLIAINRYSQGISKIAILELKGILIRFSLSINFVIRFCYFREHIIVGISHQIFFVFIYFSPTLIWIIFTSSRWNFSSPIFIQNHCNTITSI